MAVCDRAPAAIVIVKSVTAMKSVPRMKSVPEVAVLSPVPTLTVNRRGETRARAAVQISPSP